MKAAEQSCAFRLDFELRKLALVLAFSIFVLGDWNFCQKFFADDPIWQDPDMQPVEKPLFRPVSPTVDALENYFRPEGDLPQLRAQNDNTIGAVPDSSWFSNRLGKYELDIATLRNGGLGALSLDTEGNLTVLGAALVGSAEVLIVQDRNQRTFQLLFDRQGYPNLATAAHIITSKFLYAAGYNVFPTCLALIDREQLVLSPGATVRLLGGKKKPLNNQFVSFLLEQSSSLGEGRFRVAASLLPAGSQIGGFKFSGTRPDDPNDIFPHENRRELRGLKVFASWLNHYAVSSVNTLDLYLPRNERGHVRHFLIDFSTSLGSGLDELDRISPKDSRAGNEYAFLGNLKSTLKTGLSLGIWQRPWLKIDDPVEEYPEVGRIASDYFKPEKWRPNYPNLAFRRMLTSDAFWAVKILSRFTDQTVRAIVEEGRFSDPDATDFLTSVLIGRRERILQHYLRQINPLDRFRIEGGRLLFANLGEEHGVGRVQGYEFQWYDFDNDTGALSVRDREKGRSDLSMIPLPNDRGAFSMVRVRSQGSNFEEWGRAVRVYIRWEKSPEVVGLEREMAEYVIEKAPDW